jgi:hypothetical protein
MTIAAIETALQSLLTPIAGFGGRIFVNRERAYAPADLPCLEVKFTGEDVQRSAEHQQQWAVNYSLSVCVKSAEPDRPDLAAYALYDQVKALLAANMTLAGVVPDEIEFLSGRPDVDAAGEYVVRKLMLDIRCIYRLDLYGVAGDALTTATFGIDMANPRNDPPQPYGPDGQIDAQVSITLPT